MSVGAAALVHRALRGNAKVNTVSHLRRPDLARLLRYGVLVQSGGDYVPGPDLLDALDVTDGDAAKRD